MINLEDFDAFTFNGLLSSERGPNGNMLGTTAQAYAVLMTYADRQDSNLSDAYFKAIQYKLAMFDCLDRDTRLFKRRKDLNQDVSIDDYICLASVPGIAMSLYSRGYPFFYFNLERQGFMYALKRILCRHIGFVAHVCYGAGRKPNAFLRLAWALSLIVSSKKPVTNQDAWIQSWMMVYTYTKFHPNHRTPLCDYAVKVWQRKYQSNATPMTEIYRAYCNIAEHPLAKYWPEIDPI